MNNSLINEPVSSLNSGNFKLKKWTTKTEMSSGGLWGSKQIQDIPHRNLYFGNKKFQHCRHNKPFDIDFDSTQIMSCRKRRIFHMKEREKLLYWPFFLPPWVLNTQFFYVCVCDILKVFVCILPWKNRKEQSGSRRREETRNI